MGPAISSSGGPISLIPRDQDMACGAAGIGPWQGRSPICYPLRIIQILRCNLVNRKTRSMAKRKKKPVSQAEQSRRLLQAAREAGVGERATNKTLERVVREIRPTQKGSTKAKGR